MRRGYGAAPDLACRKNEEKIALQRTRAWLTREGGQVKMVKKGMVSPPDMTPHDGQFDGTLDLVRSAMHTPAHTPRQRGR
eukprot:326050-Rhodomonas_salina.2